MPTVSEIEKKVEFLKDLAEEEGQDIVRVAKDNKISNHSQLLEEVTGIAGAAYQKNRETWLQDVADYYNVGLPEQGDLLTPNDVHGLQWVFERYSPKLINQAPPFQSYNSTMSSNTPPPYTQTPVSLPPPDPRSIPEADLLRSFLMSNYNPRAHLVNEWIENQFKPHYEYFTQNPLALMQILTHNFASAGKMAYDLWAANKHRVNMDPYGQQMMPPQQPYQMMGNTTAPYGMPMLSTGGMQQPMTREEQVDNDRWTRMEKMINRTMQMKYMEMMNGMAGGNNQQPALPPGVAYQTEDVVDHNNKPTGAKRYVPVPIGQQQNQNENRLMEVILQGMQQKENILLQKIEGPNTLLEKIATTALASHQNNTDPFSAFKQMLDFSQQLNQQRGQPETKGLDVVRTEIDAKLALAQLNLAEKKEEREFNREIESERASNDNVKMYVDSIKDVITKIAGPAVSGMMQGYLQNPNPGQIQAQQAQAQMGPPETHVQQQDEAYAMQQQQAIMQQRQMEMRASTDKTATSQTHRSSTTTTKKTRRRSHSRKNRRTARTGLCRNR